MIDRTHRFQGHTSLRFVYQKGRIVRGPFSSLKVILNNRRTTYRLAVVVSRKVHKSAVVRNRIRRRIYEVVRLVENQITLPYDMVLTVHTAQMADMPFTELQRAVLFQCKKAGVFGGGTAATEANRAIVEPKES